jgi:hypothetical protein
MFSRQVPAVARLLALCVLAASQPALAAPRVVHGADGRTVVAIEGLARKGDCAVATTTGTVGARRLRGDGAIEDFDFTDRFGKANVYLEDEARPREGGRIRAALDEVLKPGTKISATILGCGAAGSIQSLMALKVLSAGDRPSVDATQRKGTITGELSYPSDFIPSDMTVCAEKPDGAPAGCTSRQRRTRKSVTYALDVAPGEYFVFARTKEMPNTKAYWSEFVRCGNDAACKSHTRLLVTVPPGGKVTGIHPQDWYVN